MSKKKKNKWKSLPSTCRTSIIGMLIFLIIGICLIVYGAFFGNVERSDIQSVEAEIVSVSRVSRNLSPSQEEDMRKKGITEDSIKYELRVDYKFTIDGKEYSHTSRKSYEKADVVKEGTKEVLRYMMVDGEPVIDPVTNGTYKVFGIIFIILGALAGVAAYVLRPKKTKKKQKPEA